MSPNNGTGYNWTNTSQWSQVPTAPIGSQNDPLVQPVENQQTQNQSYPQQPIQQSQVQAEPRIEMIRRLYRSILGREADTAGLNYFLYNTQVSEAQIAKEMYESTEHNDLLTKAKDIRSMITKMEENTKKMADMEFQMNNLQVLNENYKGLIDEKTQLINQLRGQLPEEQRMPEQMYRSQENQEYVDVVNVQPQDQQSLNQQLFDNNYSQQYTEELILDDPFDEEGYERKGFWGWVRNIFN